MHAKVVSESATIVSLLVRGVLSTRSLGTGGTTVVSNANITQQLAQL